MHIIKPSNWLLRENGGQRSKYAQRFWDVSFKIGDYTRRQNQVLCLMIYTHVIRKKPSEITSPLDGLWEYSERPKYVGIPRIVIASEAKQSQGIASSLHSSQWQLFNVVHYRLKTTFEIINDYPLKESVTHGFLVGVRWGENWDRPALWDKVGRICAHNG
jgi:hypothetical protein